MTKNEFLDALAQKLSRLSAEDRQEQLAFYREMIDDHMEEGVPEAEAVERIGSVEQVAQRILAEFPAGGLEEKPLKKHKWQVWQIVLLVLGAPLWISLLLAAAAVVASAAVAGAAAVCALYVTLWSGVAALGAAVLGSLVVAFLYQLSGNTYGGIACFGFSLVCAGLFLLALLGCIAASKGILRILSKVVGMIADKCKRKEAQA